MRLADLLAGLSRLADLGFGLHAREAVRSAALATALARSLDVPDEEIQAALYTALLHHVGCTGFAHETARIFGDELVLNVAAARTNPAELRERLAAIMPIVGMHHERLDDVRAGRLDADAVGAVRAAAGRVAVVPRRKPPVGLTDREVAVLRLLAHGRTNAQIAQHLVISRRTAEHHVGHIYTKIGVSSRADAALFAMEHGLLTDRDG